MKKNSYIKQLISQGEHQQQDFKFVINDSQKIARTLVAFANTKGGRLLIGVKDNGKVAGVRTDEEYYMIEAAAQMYCKPQIEFSRKDWLEEGKKVMEIEIHESKNKPFFAKTLDNKWKAYVRVHDENILANAVMINVWKKQKSLSGVKIRYSKAEQFILSYLNNNKFIALSRFYKEANISRYKAINILSDLIVVNLIDYHFENNTIYYRLKDSII